MQKITTFFKKWKRIHCEKGLAGWPFWKYLRYFKCCTTMVQKHKEDLKMEDTVFQTTATKFIPALWSGHEWLWMKRLAAKSPNGCVWFKSTHDAHLIARLAAWPGASTWKHQFSACLFCLPEYQVSGAARHCCYCCCCLKAPFRWQHLQPACSACLVLRWAAQAGATYWQHHLNHAFQAAPACAAHLKTRQVAPAGSTAWKGALSRVRS